MGSTVLGKYEMKKNNKRVIMRIGKDGMLAMLGVFE